MSEVGVFIICCSVPPVAQQKKLNCSIGMLLHFVILIFLKGYAGYFTCHYMLLKLSKL